MDNIWLKLYLHKSLITTIFFALSTIYFFSGIFFGLDFTDSFYHLNHAIQPPNGTYLYTFLLSSIIIKFFIEILAYELIILRFINAFLLFMAVICPFFFLRIRKPKSEILVYISCILIFMAPLNFNVLGYDTLTIFILVFIFSVLLLYLKNPDGYLVIIIAILCAMAILIRLPNIVLIPIILLVIFGVNSRWLLKISVRGILFAILYLLVTLLFVFLVYYIYYKEWTAFQSSTVVSHNAKNLILSYIKDSFKLIAFISFLLLSYFFFEKFRKTENRFLLYSVLIVIHYLFLYKFVLFTGYSWHYSLYLTSIALSIIIIHAYYNWKIRRDFKQVVLFLYLLFLFINPLGSDTGFLKGASLLFLFPFILCLIDLRIKKYWIVLVISLMPLSILQKALIIYEDSHILNLNQTVDLNLLHPIRTNEVRYNHLKNIDREVKELKEKDISVFFYGSQSHIFHYLYPGSTMNIKSFRQPIDTLIFIQDIDQALYEMDRSAIFLDKSYPVNESEKEISLLEVALIERGFKIIEHNSVSYFLR